jgi:hypothetical protein
MFPSRWLNPGFVIPKRYADMDTDMELSKKTTILFPSELYDQLSILAQQRHSSVGELVRQACQSQYSLTSKADRLALLIQMANLNLPVGTPEEMKRESLAPIELLP